MKSYFISTSDNQKIEVVTNANQKQWDKITQWINKNVDNKTKENVEKELKSFRNVVDIEIK